VQIVAVWPVGPEGFLIEEPLNTAPEAHLVGMALGPDWPAHLAVPATAKYYDPSARKAGC